MVPLQPQWTLGNFTREPPASRPCQLDVFMHHDSVVHHLLEPCIAYLVPVGIEPRPPEDDVVTLPLKRWPGCILSRRMALVSSRISIVIPSLVDAAAVIVPGMALAMAVEDLDLVTTLQVDTGVAPLRDHELHVDLNVTELNLGHQVARVPFSMIDEHLRRLRSTRCN